jgi:hypothetical protein
VDFNCGALQQYYLNIQASKTTKLTTAMMAAKLLSDSDVAGEFFELVETFCSRITKKFKVVVVSKVLNFDVF